MRVCLWFSKSSNNVYTSSGFVCSSIKKIVRSSSVHPRSLRVFELISSFHTSKSILSNKYLLSEFCYLNIGTTDICPLASSSSWPSLLRLSLFKSFIKNNVQKGFILNFLVTRIKLQSSGTRKGWHAICSTARSYDLTHEMILIKL